jgi:hypothetical protein
MTPQELHADGAALLRDLRESRARFSEVVYDEASHANGATYDTHERARYLLWLALQYDRRSGDHALVRDVFEQEVLAHEGSTFQGLDETLNLGAYLLCSFRDPSDVWLLWRAKTANFDTECGFDGEHLVAAGVAPTFTFIGSRDHTAKADLIEYLGADASQCKYDDASIATWWTHRAADFPASVAEESRTTLLYRSIALGAVGLGRELLDEWEATQPERSPDMLGQLRRRREELGQPERAVAAQRELLTKIPDTDWEVTSATRDLAQIHVHCAAWDEALETITSLESRLASFEDWKPCGLGRMVVEIALDISLGLAVGHPGKARALDWASQRLAEGCSHSPLMIDKGVAAARALADADTERFFSDLR